MFRKPPQSDEEWERDVRRLAAKHGYKVKGGKDYLPPDSAFREAARQQGLTGQAAERAIQRAKQVARRHCN